jgi:hypothetical protein
MEVITNHTIQGLTSVGKGKSAVGFVLVDRTKENYTNKVARLNLLLKVLLGRKFQEKDMGFFAHSL